MKTRQSWHFPLYSVTAILAFRFFVKITACPSQKRALEDDDDVPAEEEAHVAKRRDIKPDSKIRVLVVEGELFWEFPISPQAKAFCIFQIT